jgi:hypothetical protein
MSPSTLFAGCLTALVFASSAHAQNGAVLTAGEITALLAGKVLSYRNDKRFVGEPRKPTAWVPRTDGSYATVQFNLRSDHSVLIRCTNYARNGAIRPCQGLAANDVGVWSVEAGAICLQWLNWGTSEKRCYRLRREGDVFRAEQVSGGPSSMDGAIVRIN